MGFGIKLLHTQSPYLVGLLSGCKETIDNIHKHYQDCAIEEARRIQDINTKLCRLGAFTIGFIYNCDTLFGNSGCDDEDECSDYIIYWKRKWCYEPKWTELQGVIDNLLDEHIKTSWTLLCSFEADELKKEALEDLEILFSIVDITRTFTIQ